MNSGAANRNSITFFVERMAEHDNVKGAPIFLGTRGLFLIKRIGGLSDVTVMYAGAYRFGLADVKLLPKELKRGGYVIIMEHCEHTGGAQIELHANGIGIGKIRDLMSALNRVDVPGT